MSRHEPTVSFEWSMDQTSLTDHGMIIVKLSIGRAWRANLGVRFSGEGGIVYVQLVCGEHTHIPRHRVAVVQLHQIACSNTTR